jgi:hypothetical protein
VWSALDRITWSANAEPPAALTVKSRRKLSHFAA